MKKRTYRRRRPARKTYRRRTRRVGLSNRRALNPIPQRYVCRMKYCDNVILGDNTTPAVYYLLRLNSVYDPKVALGGHQPYGFDQISPMFTGYRVFKVSWRVTFMNGNASDPYIMAVTPINGTGYTWSNLANALEAPRTRYALYDSATSGARTIKGHVYLPSLTGVPRQTYRADNNYSSAIGGNPVLPMVLQMFASSPDETTLLPTGCVNVQIQLIYHVEFIGSVLQAQS